MSSLVEGVAFFALVGTLWSRAGIQSTGRRLHPITQGSGIKKIHIWGCFIAHYKPAAMKK